MDEQQQGDARIYDADSELLPPSPRARAPRVVCESALHALQLATDVIQRHRNRLGLRSSR